MVTRKALVDVRTDVVVNTVVVGEREYEPPDGTELRDMNPGIRIGETYSDYEERQRASDMATLPARIATRQREAEDATITVDGIPIKLDTRSMVLICGAGTAASRRPERTTRIPTPNGMIELGSTQLLDLLEAIADYVQECIDRAAELHEEIAQAEDPLTVDIDAGWPSTERSTA